MNEEFIIVDGQKVPNPEYKKPSPDGEPGVDYKTKFAESTREAQRLLEEKKRLEAENARLASLAGGEKPTNQPKTNETLYPGFEDLDDESKENLLKYTNTVQQRVREEIYQDPAIAFARRKYNEQKWNDAFAQLLQALPDLNQIKDEFKAKYFNPDNVPENIVEILTTLAKGALFDKAKEIGAKEREAQEASRIELEKGSGGDKNPPVTKRTLDDWNRLRQENPAQFARESKQFNDDLQSGRI